MAKKEYLKVPCHTVVVAGSPEAAKQVQKGVDTAGCASRKRMGVRLTDPKAELGAESLGKPCVTKRRSCPLQLIFKDGVPYLRLCKRAGNKKPGFLIPAGTPAEANTRAQAACACWRANKKSFKNCPGIDTANLGGGARRR